MKINIKILNNLKKRRFYYRLIIWGFFMIIAFIAFSHFLVKLSYQGHIYYQVDLLPENEVGLLLGTSKYLRNGTPNPYYLYRIEAAVKLIKLRKIKYIIVSGDNRMVNYNEPVQMRNDLISRGVDPQVIYLDYAGFRTLDSVIRAKKVFGQDTFTIISQQFHNERAIFIARQRNIKAIAYSARDVEFRLGIKVQFRELFARVKLLIDLFMINKQPKFLGEKVVIGS